MCRLTGQDHQRRPRQQAQCSRRRGQRERGRGSLGHTRHPAQCASLLATAQCSGCTILHTTNSCVHLGLNHHCTTHHTLHKVSTAHRGVNCPSTIIGLLLSPLPAPLHPICPTLTLIWRPACFLASVHFYQA